MESQAGRAAGSGGAFGKARRGRNAPGRRRAAWRTGGQLGEQSQGADLLHRRGLLDAEDPKTHYTALCQTAWMGSARRVQVLLEAGADPSRWCSKQSPAYFALLGSECEAKLRLLLEFGARLDDVKYGRSVLMSAAEEGGVKSVSLLLKLGADAKVKNKSGKTALSFATAPEVRALLKSR